jgi:transcriptional regulator with XRE-family HTH domain
MSDPADRSGEQTPRTLAEKVDYLFRHVHPRGRAAFTHPEAAAATGLSTGVLSALRSGKNVNPTKDTLQRLAAFFGVPVAFFFDDQTAEQVTAQIGLVAALRDAGIARAAARMVGLSSASVDAVTMLAEQLRKIEGLHVSDEGG